jgi:hypothetical protein
MVRIPRLCGHTGNCNRTIVLAFDKRYRANESIVADITADLLDILLELRILAGLVLAGLGRSLDSPADRTNGCASRRAASHVIPRVATPDE